MKIFLHWMADMNLLLKSLQLPKTFFTIAFVLEAGTGRDMSLMYFMISIFLL